MSSTYERNLRLRGKTQRINRRRYLEKSNLEELSYDLEAHMHGEPSEAFYPPPGNVIFLDRNRRTRSEIRAKNIEITNFAKQELVRLATKQISENDERLHVVTGDDPKTVISSYRKTNAYYNTARETRKLLAIGTENIDSLSRKMMGKIFEDIAFGLTSHSTSDRQVILSPQKTLILTQALYPDRELVTNAFGHNFIKDERKPYIPDGYLVDVERGLIDVGLEYTLNPFKESIDSQIKRFKEAKRRFPQMFNEKAPLFIVTHKETITDVYDNREDVKLFKLPISSRDLFLAFSHLCRK